MATRRMVKALVAWTGIFPLAQLMPADESDPLAPLMASLPAPLAAEAAAPDRRVSVRWVRVAPDPALPGGVGLSVHRFGADSPPYFYPASTVKLPTALVALEKLARLRRHHDLPALTIDSTMWTEASEPWQTAVESDPSAPDGRPTLGHYLRKVFLVSDNDAHNRLYEFVGPDEIAASLAAKGHEGVRILHRLAVGDDWRRGAQTNAVTFRDGERLVIRLPPQVSVVDRRSDEPILLGRGFLRGGVRVDEPMDFADKNALPLEAMQAMLVALVFPEAFAAERRWRIDPSDRAFILEAMATYPGDSESPRYDRARHPDGYAKFLLCGGSDRAPDHVRVFNKSGLAYGFVTDNAFVCDFATGVAFFLAATIHVNDNGIYNDDDYRYDEIAMPFLKALGTAVLARERAEGTPLPRERLDSIRRLAP